MKRPYKAEQQRLALLQWLEEEQEFIAKILGKILGLLFNNMCHWHNLWPLLVYQAVHLLKIMRVRSRIIPLWIPLTWQLLNRKELWLMRSLNAIWLILGNRKPRWVTWSLTYIYRRSLIRYKNQLEIHHQLVLYRYKELSKVQNFSCTLRINKILFSTKYQNY